MADEGEDVWQPIEADSALAQQADQVRLNAEKQAACAAKADSIIKSNVAQAMAMGLIPVPLLDVIALTNIQFKMVDDLVKLYGIRYTHIEKAVVRSFILGMLPVVAVAGLGSAFKVLPGVGSFAGGASVCIVAGGLTYATGKVFVQHFATGGTLQDLDLVTAKQHFMREFRRGKQLAKERLNDPPLLLHS
ncbi:YcjF family protein [Thiothrix fructosivorans]|uniref:DUF697 domain-containing protein n=1 Tax=Thiothrix fructosivorans TaxID=111770 RepID=A0A8B0SG61_9GAMM|nr:DUF697 domain-containing protein [Thiothrix fructosivorans]MBO0615250.1 DUF697 domain-containing protein [Thiothrix fructosivorans]QTX10034.1 DUF697 domain-containing protein [Thiothrix fructosivorans]